jgi:hypothetical protein
MWQFAYGTGHQWTCSWSSTVPLSWPPCSSRRRCQWWRLRHRSAARRRQAPLTPATRRGRSPVEGAATPDPLILGRLFRLVADRCDDLRFLWSHSFDGCGRVVVWCCSALLSVRKVSKRSRPLPSIGDLLSPGRRGSGRSRRVSATSLCRTSLDGCGHCAVRGIDT